MIDRAAYRPLVPWDDTAQATLSEEEEEEEEEIGEEEEEEEEETQVRKHMRVMNLIADDFIQNVHT